MLDTHEFDNKLQRSKAGMTAETLIQSWLTGCVSVVASNVADDRNGIDYWATLRRGAVVGIDHKLRDPGCSKFWKLGWPELALEIWSVTPENGKPGATGWTLDEAKNTDYILYTFDPGDSDEAYLVPFQLLRLVFRKHFDEWCAAYHPLPQKSYRAATGHSWHSEAVFVPAPVVLDAVRDEMECRPVLAAPQEAIATKNYE